MNTELILQQSIQKLFDKGSSVLFRWRNDSSWSIDYVSENVSKLLGYSSEEFIQKQIIYTECIHKDFLTQVQNEVLIAAKHNNDFFEHKPYKIITKDKKEKWVLDQTVIEKDENGNITHYIGYINDITKNIELSYENELLQERIALAVESISDGIWDWDIKSDEAFFSTQWKNMLGYAKEELPNNAKTFFNLIHPDDRAKAQSALEKHFQNSNIPFAIEIRLLCKDGSYKWVLSRGKAIFDAAKNPLRMLGSHVDISHQKEVENKLEESEFRWKFAIEGSGDGLWDWNLETDEVFYSPQWKSMLGFEENEIETSIEAWSKMVHPKQLEGVYKKIQNYIDGKSKKYISEHQILCKDGSYKWILDRGVFVTRDADGKPTRMIGTHTDIDQNKKIQDQLNRLNQRFTNMFKNHNAIMLLIDPISEKIIDANLSAQKFYGYTLEEFTNLNIHDINTASQEEIVQSKQQASLNKINCFEFEHKKKNGELAITEVHTSIIETDQGNILFSIIMDVTKEKENEKQLKKVFKQLQQAQKIAKIGLWEHYHKTDKIEWSKEAYNIFEIDSNKTNATNEVFFNIVHPEDREEVQNSYVNSLITQEPYEITHRLLMPDGRVKYVLEQCNTEFDSDGIAIVSRGTVQDITEFKMLDATIRNERRRFKTLMNNASDGILIINEELKLIDYSNVAKTMLGYSDEEMLKLYIKDWDIYTDQNKLDAIIESLSDTPVTFERLHKRKDGTTYNASLTSVAMEIDGEKYIYASVRDITEIKKLQNDILYEKNFIETIIESSNAIIAVINSDGRMIKLNSYGENFSGYTQEEISQEPFKWKCLLPLEVQNNVVSIVENAKQGNIVKSFQNAWHSKSGEVRMFEWSNTLVKKEDGSMDYIATIGIDITQNEEQKAFLNLLINSQSHMLILADGNELKYINQAVLDFFDFSTLEQMQEKYACVCDTFIENNFSFHLGKTIEDEKWIDSIQKLPSEKQIVSIYSVREKREKTFKVNIEHYNDSTVYLLTFVDISDTMTKQFELEYKSSHDPLTKTYNRTHFYENSSSIMESHRINNQLTAVAMIDIDHFKLVNDTYGHDVGDNVLKQLVNTIKRNSRQNDILIRWGGEEFILLMPINNEKNLHKTLESLREVIARETVPVVGNITVSIGASIYKTPESIEDTINRSDNNLYTSKKSGRNKVTVF
jgi:diguanylate cyclase (GGDEF)-like protein/PAS domain S-box-containing protein